MRYILASASPRRKEILSSLGLKFDIIVADTDESSDERDLGLFSEALAKKKGLAVRDKLVRLGEYDGNTAIISADTIVVSDGEVLGKPRDRADAERMLRALSGRTHAVISGVAITIGDKTVSDHSVTEVTFDEIDEEFLCAYLDSDEPYDKAGAYGIQGTASAIVKGICGCYFGVVGLPVNCLINLAKKNNIKLEFNK